VRFSSDMLRALNIMVIEQVRESVRPDRSLDAQVVPKITETSGSVWSSDKITSSPILQLVFLETEWSAAFAQARPWFGATRSGNQCRKKTNRTPLPKIIMSSGPCLFSSYMFLEEYSVKKRCCTEYVPSRPCDRDLPH